MTDQSVLLYASSFYKFDPKLKSIKHARTQV